MSNFEEALERFLLLDFEYAGGFANHGPMAAQALVELGHQALIPAFVDRYAPRVPLAPPGRVLRADERRACRGQPDRASDWAATFEAELTAAGRAGSAGPGGWWAVVREHVPALLPGLFAAAGHGLLRTVHALRALEREDTAPARRELARGLAYWAAGYQRLPGAPGSLESARSSSTALIAALRAWPVRDRPPAAGETFTASARALADDPAFVAAVAGLPLPAEDEVDEFLAVLCRTAAGLYLAHPEFRVAYAHAVTLPSALRWLAPRLAPADARLGAGFAAQAVGALHALYGDSAKSAEAAARLGAGQGRPVGNRDRGFESQVDDEVRKTAGSWDEIRYRAACSLEEHAIKLAEACWREDRHRPDPVFRLAAADAALRLDGSRSAVRC